VAVVPVARDPCSLKILSVLRRVLSLVALPHFDNLSH
jgi:hypothetical protein